MSGSGKLVEVSIVNGGGAGDEAEREAEVYNDDSEDHTTLLPIITLPEVSVPTMEEEEVELINMRAKLFRYDTNESPPEWKERGTGDVKLLRHKEKNTVRVVMRRDKTLKICANHFVTPFMELKPNCGSDRAWVWSVLADFADETAKPELLAIRFANSDNAKKWKEMFEEAKYIVANHCKLYTKTVEELCREEEEAEEEEEEEEGENSDEDNENVNNDSASNVVPGKDDSAEIAKDMGKLNLTTEEKPQSCSEKGPENVEKGADQVQKDEIQN